MAVKKTSNDFKPVSAEEFKTSGGSYRFPFVCMDPTPGGQNLGRIEWCIEPQFSKRKREGRYYIDKLYVWAKQTRDPRYFKKIFEIECYAEAMTGDSVDRNSFLNHVWYFYLCPEHKSTGMWAYPRNEHTALEISTFSSISLTAKFV